MENTAIAQRAERLVQAAVEAADELRRQLDEVRDQTISRTETLLILREIYYYYLYFVWMMTQAGHTSLNRNELSDLAAIAGGLFLTFLGEEANDSRFENAGVALAEGFDKYYTTMRASYSPKTHLTQSLKGTTQWGAADRINKIVPTSSVEGLALTLDGILMTYHIKYGLTK
jgi:hypothetical protein